MDKAFKCSNGCGKYSKTTDEIFEAATKHREAALVLKDLSEKQKYRIQEQKQTIEKLECKNEKLENEVKLSTKKLKLKIEEHNHSEDALENENKQLKERVEKLCRKNEKNWKEIGNFCSNLEEEKIKVEEKNKEIEIFVRRKEVTDRILKNLQIEKEELEEKVKTVSLAAEVKQSEIDALKSQKEDDNRKWSAKDIEYNLKISEEIEDLHKENTAKENMLKEVASEKELFREKLEKLEKENYELKEELEQKDIEKEEQVSLSEELGMLDPRSQNVSIECDPCGLEFKSNECANIHIECKHSESSAKEVIKWKLKELELERNLFLDKLKLTSALIKLKENEICKEKTCKCRGFCRIHHHKHNWVKSKSKEFHLKFSSLTEEFRCDICGNNFESKVDLEKHTETNHKRRKSENGGI